MTGGGEGTTVFNRNSLICGPLVKATSFQAICNTLNRADVRFLVAGGLAVNAHGYLRFTRDVDLAVELVPEAIEKTFSALAAIGYHPNVPVSAKELADAQTRKRLIAERNMQVLQFWSDEHPDTPVDIFVSHSFDFDQEYRVAPRKSMKAIGDIAFVSYDTLIAMKKEADRPQDRLDVMELEARIERKDHDPDE